MAFTKYVRRGRPEIPSHLRKPEANISKPQPVASWQDIELDDDDQKWLWSECILPLIRKGVIKPPDAAVVTGALTWWSLWNQQRRTMKQSDFDWKVYSTLSGSWKQFLICVGKLGLSPKDREKLANGSLLDDDINCNDFS